MAETVEIVFDDKVIKGKDLTKFTQLMDQYLQAYNSTVGTSSNPNILINPDLAINQQGIETYTSIGGKNNLLVDGWVFHISAGTTYDVPSKTITIPQSEAGHWYGIEQTIKTTSRISTGFVTLSASVTTTVDVYMRLIYEELDNAGSLGANEKLIPAGYNGIVSLTGEIPDGTHLCAIQLSNIAHATDGGSVKVDWVKLERGSVATRFTPPNPTEELVKCQRYFQISEDVGSVVGTVIALSSTTGVAVVPVPVSMESIPSIALNAISLIGVGSLNTGDITITGIDADTISMGSGTVSFNITATDLVAGATYLMKIGDGGYLIHNCR